MAIRASSEPGSSSSPASLLLEEAVVRLVVVEALDDVVAVSPGVRLGGVELVAVGLGVADQVQPVPAPALAVARGREQSVDHLVVSLGRSVGEEGVDLIGGRREPGEVVSGPAEQRRFLGRRGGSEAGRFELRQDEAVDRRSGPRRVLDLRDLGAGQPSERPEVPGPIVDRRRP